jgi:hypothetical protein
MRLLLSASPQPNLRWIPTLVLVCICSGLGILADLLRLLRLWAIAPTLTEQFADWIGLISLPLVNVTLGFVCLLHYACWRALPAIYRCTTPKQAVVYLFIPIYNFYWVFVSVVGMAHGYVKFRRANELAGIPNRIGLGIAHAILVVLGLSLSWVPGLAGLILTADLVIFILFYKGMVRASQLAIQSEGN